MSFHHGPYIFVQTLFKKTEHTDYFSKNRNFLYNDRIHKIIFRLEAENSFFFVKVFDKYIPEETSEPNPDSVVDHSLDSDNKNL